METRRTAFSPDVHGWPFGNLYRYTPGIGPVRLPFSVELGFCGGMVFCALDRFHGGEAIAADLERPVQGHSLFGELFKRQRQTLIGGVTLRTWRWQLRGDEELGPLTTQEWETVRRGIDAGHPVVICLIREKGVLGKVWNNHQVVVHGYHMQPSGRVALFVYDPNHRRRADIRIEFTPGSRLDGSQSTGERMRGFFVIPYDRPVPASG